MTGTLDQSELGSAVGGVKEVARIGNGDLQVVGSVTDQQPTWRNLGNRVQRVDFEHVRPQLFGTKQFLGVGHHAGDLDRTVELLGGAAPRFKMRRRGERGNTVHSFVARGDAQRQRTTEAEAPPWKSGDRPGPPD